jgi:hypothetical protein
MLGRDLPTPGCRTGPPAYVAWRAGTTTYAGVKLVNSISQSGTMNLATKLELPQTYVERVRVCKKIFP